MTDLRCPPGPPWLAAVRSFAHSLSPLLLAACTAATAAPPAAPAPAPAPASALQAATRGTPSTQASASASYDRPQFPSTYQRRTFAPVLIRNATILTAAGPEQAKASILFADGKIVAVGPDIAPPAGATVIDGTGKFVTPGIIDTHSHLGVYAA